MSRPLVATLVALLATSEALAAEPPVGPQFRVNTYATGVQRAPSVALLGGSNHVVTWQSAGQDGSGYGVFGQRVFDYIPLGGEFRVNSYTSLDQSSPRVVASQFGDGPATKTPTEAPACTRRRISISPWSSRTSGSIS
jgi:hypothetical protein